MSKSSLDPATIEAPATEGLDHYDALDIAQRDGISVEHAQNRHHAAQVLASGWTPTGDKLANERERVEKQLADIESRQRIQEDLAQHWESLIQQRNDLARLISNASLELADLTSEIVGREQFIVQTCIGQPLGTHGSIHAYSSLAGIIVGMREARKMVEDLLPKLKQSHSDKLSEIGSFAKANGINVGNN